MMRGSSRLRRSVLFMPGSNARALEKARQLPADGLIFDLEDAVAPGAKVQARQAVGAALAAGGYGRRELVVRVNALGTEWGEADLAAASRMPLDGVLLPKVESVEAVRQVDAVLDRAGTPAHVAIWCMVETPLGVLRAEAIAGATDRVGVLVMGTSDLATDLKARDVPGRLPLLPSLGLCVLAARAHGRAVLDGVHLDLADTAGFLDACRQGRDLGFDGKTLIHPKTIAAANTIFAPCAAEVDWARRIIAAHDAALAAGQGIVLVDGKLIEALHVARAREVVASAETISALGPAG